MLRSSVGPRRRPSLVLVVGAGAAALAASADAVAQSAFAPGSQPGANVDSSAASRAPPAATQSPRLVHFVEAVYPPEARASGLEAQVVLEITIDETGHVREATVSEPAGHGFDEAAIAAARQFVFAPAQRDGRPVPARIHYRYRFSLAGQGSSSPAPPAGPVAIIEGVVHDARDRAVRGVAIAVHQGDEPARDVPIDATGAFHIEVDRAGMWIVNAIAPGMRPFRAEESLTAGDHLRVTYRLEPATQTSSSAPTSSQPSGGTDAITVRGRLPPREVSRTTLDRRELQRIPGTGGDALRAIQNLPGLARPPLLSGALIVRGSAPQDTQVFADGMPIPLLYHFGGLTSTIPTEMLDRIDFYPGNFSAPFGRAMGGIVDVGLRSPRTSGFHGVATISIIDAAIFFEGAIVPNLSFAVAFRRSYIDAILGAVLANTPNVNVTASPVYYDYQAVLEWRPNAHNRLRLAFLGDDDTLSVLFQRAGNNAALSSGLNLALRYHLVQLSWNADLAPGTQARAMVSGGWTNNEVSFGTTQGLANDTVPFTSRLELSHRLDPMIRVNTGFDGQFGTYSLQLNAPTRATGAQGSVSQATDVSGTYLQLAAYVDAEITPVRGLRIVPAVRFDYFDTIRAATVSPRLSMRWNIFGGLTLRGGIGLYTQAPTFTQSSAASNLYFPGQTLGNPNLLPQRAMHYAFGAEYQFTRYLSASAEGFYKTLTDLVVSTPTASRLQIPPGPPYINAGAGRVYGLEVLVRHQPSEYFFGWLAYTLMRSERQDAPGQDWHVFQYDQTHILTLIGSVRLPYGFEIGARFRYVTGSPVTPVIGSFYNGDSGGYTPVYGPAYSTRDADFHQLDLRIDKTFRVWRGNIDVFLEVLNVYNHANQEGIQYNFDYTQSQPINGLPIIPNLGIRGEL